MASTRSQNTATPPKSPSLSSIIRRESTSSTPCSNSDSPRNFFTFSKPPHIHHSNNDSLSLTSSNQSTASSFMSENSSGNEDNDDHSITSSTVSNVGSSTMSKLKGMLTRKRSKSLNIHNNNNPNNNNKDTITVTGLGLFGPSINSGSSSSITTTNTTSSRAQIKRNASVSSIPVSSPLFPLAFSNYQTTSLSSSSSSFSSTTRDNSVTSLNTTGISSFHSLSKNESDIIPNSPLFKIDERLPITNIVSTNSDEKEQEEEKLDLEELEEILFENIANDILTKVNICASPATNNFDDIDYYYSENNKGNGTMRRMSTDTGASNVIEWKI